MNMTDCALAHCQMGGRKFQVDLTNEIVQKSCVIFQVRRGDPCACGGGGGGGAFGGGGGGGLFVRFVPVARFANRVGVGTNGVFAPCTGQRHLGPAICLALRLSSALPYSTTGREESREQAGSSRRRSR